MYQFVAGLEIAEQDFADLGVIDGPWRIPSDGEREQRLDDAVVAGHEVRNTVVMNDGEVVTPDMLPAPLDRFAAEAKPGGQPAARREDSNDIASRHEAASETAAEPGSSSTPEMNSSPLPLDPSRLIMPMTRLEREAIERAIELCDGNVPRAAHYLGISGATIYRKRAAWKQQAAGGSGSV